MLKSQRQLLLTNSYIPLTHEHVFFVQLMTSFPSHVHVLQSRLNVSPIMIDLPISISHRSLHWKVKLTDISNNCDWLWSKHRLRGYNTIIYILYLSVIHDIMPPNAGVAEGAQTWGGHFWIFIYTALSALRATSLAHAQKCILGRQYSEKRTIPLTSSSIRLATFIVQNSNLNCGF